MTDCKSLRQNQALEAVSKAMIAIADQDASASRVTESLVDVRDTVENTSESEEFIQEIANIREAVSEFDLSGSDRKQALGALRDLDRRLRVELSAHSVTECLRCEATLDPARTESICEDCTQRLLHIEEIVSAEVTDSEKVVINPSGPVQIS